MLGVVVVVVVVGVVVVAQCFVLLFVTMMDPTLRAKPCPQQTIHNR